MAYNRAQQYNNRAGASEQPYDTKGPSVAIKKKPFDIMDGVIRVQGGKAYLTVDYRIYEFRRQHPDWPITTEVQFYERPNGTETASYIRCTATIRMPVYREVSLQTGPDTYEVSRYVDHYEIVQTGDKEERIGDFSDPLEKCVTGAIGRALMCIGIGTLLCGDDLAESKPVDSAARMDDRLVEPEGKMIGGRVEPKAPAVARPGRYDGDERYDHSEFGVCKCKSIVEVRFDSDDVEYGHFDFDGLDHKRSCGLYASGWRREDLPAGAVAYKKRNRAPADAPPPADAHKEPVEAASAQASLQAVDTRPVDQQLATAVVDDAFADDPADGQQQVTLDLAPTSAEKPSSAQLAAQRRRLAAK